MHEARSEPTPGRKAAVVFVFVTVMLDMLALGVIIPVLPKLILAFKAGDTARAAEILGIFGTVWALMQFLSGPVLGALSDRYGRRPIILLSNLGLGLDYILMALAPNLILLFIGRVISGITAASVSTAFAYVADVTEPQKRAAAYGFLGAAFGVGFVLGPAIGGLLGGIDPRLPFWVAAVASLLNALYGWLVLPESLPPERRSPFKLAKANPIGSLGLIRSHPALVTLASAHFLSHLAHVALPSVFVLYAFHRYGWGEEMVGITLALVGFASMIVQGGLVGPVVKWLGQWRTWLAGLAAGTIGFAVYGWAPTGALFFAGIPIMALWGLAGPASQGLMTALVGPSDQGKLQGALSSLQGIAGLIGPGLFTFVFAFFIDADAPIAAPGAPYLLSALLLLAGLLIAIRSTAMRAQASPSHP